MTDISILEGHGRRLLGATRSRPVLSVNAPGQYVFMDEGIAQIRGLRGFNNKVENWADHSRHLRNEQFSKNQSSETKGLIKRRVRITDDDRQLAELSISHDGNYATAVCMALDEKGDNAQQKPDIVDDGVGDPIHEPEWGDEGWFTLPDGEDEQPEDAIISSEE